ncbi:helix-turn-helix transcriptional regulator [Solirubrobacter taibaiensis]|nr:helix-turn-helix transcriptional regulator [Solirubrobacter taibaiensis]
MTVLVADHTGTLAALVGRPVTAAVDADGAADALRAGGADAAVVHAQLPPEGGVAATRRLASQGAAVVLVDADSETVAAALRAGARAVLGRADGALLELALAAACDGAVFVAPATGLRALAAAGDEPFPALSARERDVLIHLAKGAPPPQVAVRLGLAPKTVRRHVRAILAKLSVPDATSAGRAARAAGLG